MFVVVVFAGDVSAMPVMTAGVYAISVGGRTARHSATSRCAFLLACCSTQCLWEGSKRHSLKKKITASPRRMPVYTREAETVMKTGTHTATATSVMTLSITKYRLHEKGENSTLNSFIGNGAVWLAQVTRKKEKKAWV